jgi:hypothetical protein
VGLGDSDCDPQIFRPAVLRQYSSTQNAILMESPSPDVALFLPFLRHRERQTVANAGTKRRSKIDGFCE